MGMINSSGYGSILNSFHFCQVLGVSLKGPYTANLDMFTYKLVNFGYFELPNKRKGKRKWPGSQLNS